MTSIRKKVVLALDCRLGPKRKWISMREAIPSVGMLWDAFGGRRGWRTVRISPSTLPKNIARHLLEADFIAMPDAQSWLPFIWTVRERLKINIPCVAYTYAEACAAASTTRIHNIARTFKSGDILLCTSVADRRALSLYLPDARVMVLPLPILSLYPDLLKRGVSRRRAVHRSSTFRPLFVYAGRISEQKNIHVFLLALWIVRMCRPHLRWRADIYGKPDYLGSPNMGFNVTNYAQYLKSLARALGITHRVSWRGFLQPLELGRELAAKPHVFVSPSLNSDENFGVAALKSLALGCPAVLSDWGGHRDFKSNFPQQVFPVPVQDSEFGPHLSPVLLAKRMVRAAFSATAPSIPTKNSFAPYTVEKGVREIGTILDEYPGWSKEPLKLSPLAHRIRRRLGRAQARLSNWQPDLPSRPKIRVPPVYRHYGDPLIRPLLRAYGLQRQPKVSANGGRIILTPWTEVRAGRVLAKDPRRGPLRRNFRPLVSPASGVEVWDIFGRMHKIPRGCVLWLLRSGLAFKLPPRTIEGKSPDNLRSGLLEPRFSSVSAAWNPSAPPRLIIRQVFEAR